MEEEYPQQKKGGSQDNGGGQVFRGMDHQTLCEKLQETVDMIKELYQGNKGLRENVQYLTEDKNTKKGDNYFLQVENRELRDRIEMYENVIGA